jgi:hypothetical protein
MESFPKVHVVSEDDYIKIAAWDRMRNVLEKNKDDILEISKNIIVLMNAALIEVSNNE